MSELLAETAGDKEETVSEKETNPRRQPGVSGNGYDPEVGDIVHVNSGGHGMVSKGLIKSSVRRVHVMRRYAYTVTGADVIPCLVDVEDLTLVIPHEAK